MKRVLTATALLMATTGLASAEGSLQLYNWGNYTSPELLEKSSSRRRESWNRPKSALNQTPPSSMRQFYY